MMHKTIAFAAVLAVVQSGESHSHYGSGYSSQPPTNSPWQTWVPHPAHGSEHGGYFPPPPVHDNDANGDWSQWFGSDDRDDTDCNKNNKYITGDDDHGPLHVKFPFLFPHPVEVVGSYIEKFNWLGATLAARLDFVQEIRVDFACPTENCINGCPATDELRMQAGCIVPRDVTPLQVAPVGQSVVVIEVLIVGTPSPEDIETMHEIMKGADLDPAMAPDEMMHYIHKESEYHHHHHHHRGHVVIKILCVAGVALIVILSVALCCCCCRKRKARRSEATKVQTTAAPQPMQAIPIPEGAPLQQDTFVFDPVVKVAIDLPSEEEVPKQV